VAATCAWAETGIRIVWTQSHTVSIHKLLYSNWMLFIHHDVCNMGTVDIADVVDMVDAAGMVGAAGTVDMVSAAEVVDVVDMADTDAVKGSLGMWEINIGHL